MGLIELILHMDGDIQVVRATLVVWLIITMVIYGGLMPLLGVSDGTCAASRYSAGSAAITISACLKPTSAAPQSFFNLSLTAINSGLVNLTLEFFDSGSYQYNPFLVEIYRTDGQPLGSFSSGGFAHIVTGLTVRSSLSNRFDWIPLLGVSGRFTNWMGLAPSWDKPGLYFVQVTLGAFIFLENSATTLFNSSYQGSEIRTPMIAYQVAGPLAPFSYFQIAVLSLLGVNAVITVFILLSIRRLLSKRSKKSDKPQPNQV